MRRRTTTSHPAPDLELRATLPPARRSWVCSATRWRAPAWVLACALTCLGCQASLADRTPADAAQPLPGAALTELPLADTSGADPFAREPRSPSGPPAPVQPPTPVQVPAGPGDVPTARPPVGPSHPRDFPEGPPPRIAMGSGVPAPPPPPDWDPSQDQVVRVLPDGTRVVDRMRPDLPGRPAPTRAAPAPVPAQPDPTQPAPTQPAPVRPPPVHPAPGAGDPWLPGAGAPAGTPTEEPGRGDLPPAGPGAGRSPWDGAPPSGPTPVRPPAVTPPAEEPAAPPPAPPADSSDDLGPPPGGVSPAPLPATPGSKPAVRPPAPAAPAAPGGEPDAPASAPAARDPWLPGAPQGAPSAPPAGPAVPADPEQRVLAHVTRLQDRAGAADLQGYPQDLVRRDDAGMALTPGARPALVVFYDDTSRASDLQAARLLPMLVRLRPRIDFVAIDRSRQDGSTQGERELTRRYFNGVPSLAVLDGQRQTRLYAPGMVEGERVERALLACLGEQPGAAAPSPGPARPPEPVQVEPAPPEPVRPPASTDPDLPPAGPAGTDPWAPRAGSVPPVGPTPVQPPEPVQPPAGPTPTDPWLPGGTQPTQPTEPTPAVEPAPVAPPAGPAPTDPWLPGGVQPAEPTPSRPPPVAPAPVVPPAGPAPGDPWLPGGAPPTQPTEPAPAAPPGPAPVDPFARPPTEPTAPAPGDSPEERGGMSFTPPAVVRAKEHAARLRSAPGESTLAGYPEDVLARAPAERVLGTGTKPCVVIFYDDASKASDLQAAEFLPLLARRAADVDVVVLDVGPKARWDEAQKKVVRTYYNFYVPTTVVLAPNRAPVKSWYSRIKAEDLERAIDEALQR